MDDSKDFQQIYKDIAEIVGTTAAKKIWKNYRGLTVSFPNGLYSKEYIRNYVRDHMEIVPIKEIARELNLTDRRVRQIIQELKKN